MSYTIDASNLLTRRYMRFDPTSVAICESTVASDERAIAYGQIDAILLSPDGMLSFQVGRNVFKIQTKPEDAGHQQAIRAFVEYVTKAASPLAFNSVNNT